VHNGGGSRAKKVPSAEGGAKQRRGRPPGDAPPVPNAERQRAHRERRRSEGKQMLHLALYPVVVRRLDRLRGEGASREAVIERLISAELHRRRR
jgi:hypothetical protein